MKIFNIKFIKKNNERIDEKINSERNDRYDEIGKLVKDARIKNNLSIRELSKISKIPESSINSIENNVKDLRPKYPFIKSILLKLEKCLSLKDDALVGLTIEETNIFYKSKTNLIIRKFDFLNSGKVIFIYFLFLISTLFFVNWFFISNINVIEFQIIEKKIN